MDNDVKILDVLNQSHKYYFSNSRLGLGSSQDITERDIVLYRIDEITFEEEAPRKEALENVLSSVRISGVNFLYLIVGDAKGVKFYYGLSKNPSEAINDDLLLSDIGRNVLMASIKGNFRGCKVQEVNPEEAEPVLNKVRHMKYASRIEGVAGTIKDNEEFQSVDRLVDVMQGEEFCLLLVAKIASVSWSRHCRKPIRRSALWRNIAYRRAVRRARRSQKAGQREKIPARR